MAFIRYKKVYNNTYAYEVWKEKDENGKWRQRSKYLGVVIEAEKGIIERKRTVVPKQETQILDYGDSYFLDEATKELPVINVLRSVFGKFFELLMALCFHRIIGGDAMCHAQNWYEGNYVSKLFPNADMSSQNISRFLSYLGEESVQRAFFAEYLPLVCGGEKDTNTVIDSTGLPNDINIPITVFVKINL